MWSSVPPVQSDSRILWSTVSLERTNSYPRFYAGRYWIKEGIMWDCQFFLGEARFVFPKCSHCTFWEKTPQVHWIIIREWPKNTTHHILRNLDNFPHGAFYPPPPNNYARKSNDWFILKDKHWTKVSVLQHATALIFKRWCLFKSKRRTLHFQRESSLLSTAEENVEPSQASVMELHHRLLTWL